MNLKLRQQLHGGEFRRAGDRAARKQRLQHLQQIHIRPRLRANGRGHLPDAGVALKCEKLINLYAASVCYAPQIIAQQIDNHHILGAVFGRCAQRLGKLRVLRRPQPAWARALHGFGGDVAVRIFARAIPMKKQFGRGAR